MRALLGWIVRSSMVASLLAVPIAGRGQAKNGGTADADQIKAVLSDGIHRWIGLQTKRTYWADYLDKIFVDPQQWEKDGWPCPRPRASKDGAETDAVALLFRADGVIDCGLDRVPQFWKITVVVAVPEKVPGLEEAVTAANKGRKPEKPYDLKSRYVISVVPGEPPKTMPLVRGDLSAAIAAAKAGILPSGALFAATEADFGRTQYATYEAPGPYDADQITVGVGCEPAGVNKETKVDFLRPYPFNLAVAAALGGRATTYSVENNQIAATTDAASLDYYVALEWSFAAWHRRNGATRNGRYYAWRADSWYDMFNWLAGFSVSHPLDKFLVGLEWQPIAGVGVFGGVQPRRVESLKSGYSVGGAFTGGSAPVDKKWDVTWAAGLSFDTSIASTLVDAFKK